MIDEGKGVRSRSWAFLHPDLLGLISKRLYDAFDFIHFRAVCKLWRAAAPISDRPPQFPFFLFRESIYSCELKLCSYTGKTRTLQVPEVGDKEYLKSQSQGYLITYRYCNGDIGITNTYLLINPFTRAQRQLPFRSCNCTEILHVSGDPIQNAGDLIMHMMCPSQWKFVRLNQNQCKEWNIGNYPCLPSAYYKGRLFYSDWSSKTHVIIDLTTGETSEITFPRTNNGFMYLVEGPGTLFGIQKVRHSDITLASLDLCSFVVYCLDENEKTPRWVKQSNIGDLMIFLNDGGGFCLSANDFDGFKGNCIYFSNSSILYANQHSIRRYDLGKDKAEVIREVKSNGCWIVPNVY